MGENHNRSALHLIEFHIGLYPTPRTYLCQPSPLRDLRTNLLRNVLKDSIIILGLEIDMTVKEMYLSGDPILSGDTSPEAIARYVVGFQAAHHEVATGWPDTSPIGLRYLAAASPKQQHRLLDQNEDDFNQLLVNELREKGDCFGSAVHMTWRLTRQVRHFAANKTGLSPDTIIKDIAVLDSDLMKWTKVEPAFRYGSSLVLSKLIGLEESDAIQIETPKSSGKEAATIVDIGSIQVRNQVQYAEDNISLVHSSYDFSRLPQAV